MDFPNWKNWSLEKRVLATLAFFDLFGRGLVFSELNNLLLGHKVDENTLKVALDNLKDQLSEENGKFFLKNSRITRLEDFDGEFFGRKINKLKKTLSRLPFLRMVAVCNYLPLGIADQESDIDLFVVTKANRIFLARTILTIYLQLKGMRRHGKKISGRFCLSFYANEDFLNFEDFLIEEDIYMAYWFRALKPIYGSSLIYENLIKTNQKILNDFFGDYHRLDFENINFDSGKTGFLEKLLSGVFGDLLEAKLTKYYQKRHQQKSKTLPGNASVIVDSRRLKFHNNDRRKLYRDEWLVSLKRLGGF